MYHGNTSLRLHPKIDKNMTLSWLPILKFMYKNGCFEKTPYDLALACYRNGLCIIGNTYHEKPIIIPFSELAQILRVLYLNSENDYPLQYMQQETFGIGKIKGIVAKIRLGRE